MAAARGLLRALYNRLDTFLRIDVCPQPIVLSHIACARDVERWRVFSDAAFGGNSAGALELCSSSERSGGSSDEGGDRSSSGSQVSAFVCNVCTRIACARVRVRVRVCMCVCACGCPRA